MCDKALTYAVPVQLAFMYEPRSTLFNIFSPGVGIEISGEEDVNTCHLSKAATVKAQTLSVQIKASMAQMIQTVTILPYPNNHGGTVHDRVVEMGEINGCVRLQRSRFHDAEVAYRVQECILVVSRKITGSAGGMCTG